MITNCGNITPRWYDVNCGFGPSLQTEHLPYMHSMLCQWAYNPALPFFFVVVINLQNKGHLFKAISKLGEVEPRKYGAWKISNSILNAVFNSRTQDTIGCIFAQGCSIPGDGFTSEQFGGGQMGGYLKSPGATTRNNFNMLEIGFYESNLSFTDMFLRPWSIIAAYKGLISDDGSLQGSGPYWGGSIKANIDVYALAKAGNGSNHCTPSVIRKEYHYYDCVPSDISDDKLEMSNRELNQRQVKFLYNYYTTGQQSNQGGSSAEIKIDMDGGARSSSMGGNSGSSLGSNSMPMNGGISTNVENVEDVKVGSTYNIQTEATTQPWNVSVHYNRNGTIRSSSNSGNINGSINNSGFNVTQNGVNVANYSTGTLFSDLFSNATGAEAAAINRGPTPKTGNYSF